MLNVLLRTILIFFVLAASMRLLGKRQLGELELSELIVAVLVSKLSGEPSAQVEALFDRASRAN